MKKILSLLLIFILLFLCVGCDQREEPTEQPTQTEETLGQNEPANKARDIYVPKVEIDANIEFEERIFTFLGVSFEELLSRTTTTDVVIGEYLGAAYVLPNYYFFFKVDRLIKGEIHQETIAVCTDRSSYYYEMVDYFETVENKTDVNVTLSVSSGLSLYSSRIPNGQKFYTKYREGHHYLLLLNRISTPHLKTEDLLRFTEESIGIPVDKDGVPVVVSSKMYDTSLTSNIENEEIKQRVTNGELIDVILELTKDDVYQESSVNIVDKNTVLANATYILNVEVYYENRDYENDLYSSYDCNVISVEKGDISRKKIALNLTDSKVKIGGKYTVALDENFELVSRNAIFEIPE